MINMIIQNAITCKHCKDVLVSSSIHDYVRCKCNTITNDGGIFYQHIGYKKDLENDIDFSLTLRTSDSFDLIKDKLLWGTYGKLGNEPLTYKFIKDLQLDHLQNILKNVQNISEIHKKVINFWILEKLLQE